jgi:hypothetical protein
MLAKEQISQMSSTERMEAMELLWESFATEGIDYPSPDWHGKVLAERSEIINSAKATWLSVDELQARLADRLKSKNCHNEAPDPKNLTQKNVLGTRAGGFAGSRMTCGWGG